MTLGSIGSSGNTGYLYIKTQQQTTQAGKSGIKTNTDSTASSGSGALQQDTVEISGEAYARYNASQTSDSDRKKSMTDVLDSLVSDGTITSEQETAIAEALKPPEKPDGDAAASGTTDDNPLKKALDSLVSSGTITSDQETAIASALKPPEKPDEDSAASGTTEDNPLKKALASLVSSGTITSDQETAIASALKPPEKPDEDAAVSGTTDSDPMKTALSSLVSSGTITAEQMSSILSAIAPESE